MTPVISSVPNRIERAKKGPHCNGDCQGEDRIGNQDSREEKQTNARAQHQSRVKSRVWAERPLAKAEGYPAQRHDHKCQRQACRPIVDAKDAVRNGGQPVTQWRLFKIRDAVKPRSYPVARLKHVASDLCLHSIDIIHEMRRAERSTEKNGGGEKNDDHGSVGTPLLCSNV